MAALDTRLETDLSSKFLSLKRVAMSLLAMEANHRLKERESSLYLDYRTLQTFYRSKGEPAEYKSDMRSRLHGAVLQGKVSCHE